MKIKFQSTSNFTCDMIVDGHITKTKIAYNPKKGLDQRPIAYINLNLTQDEEEQVEIEADNIEMFNTNFDYICTFWGMNGRDIKKEYPITWENLKHIFN